MSRLVRIWLLVLLTALLPVRGALAAAMLCAPASASHSQHQGHDMAQHEHHQAAGEHHQHDGGDRCSLCASCCTAVPLMGVLPSVPQPFDAPQQFPALHTPAPSFVSDGWERPPRSI